MGLRAIGIYAAILSAIPAVAPADAGDRPALVVRIYSNHTVSNPNLDTAHTFVDAILTQAGIQVSWLDCGARRKAPGDSRHCDQPVVGNEVVLRIGMTGPVERRRHSSLGESLVSGRSEGAAPRFATVFADRVTAMARDANVKPGRLLGYAIAHEVGHLLLNDVHHPAAGLMRAVWSRVELQRNVPADWLFAATEAETIRGAVAARSSRQ